MKRSKSYGHSPIVSPSVALSQTSSALLPTLTVSDIHELHSEFVWGSLHRLGVREADLPDLTQEVFLIVHRKLDSWDEECKVTTWLFGICRKVAAGYRRKSWFRRERPLEERTVSAEQAPRAQSPEDQALLTQARRRLKIVLSSLSPDRRAVFVMFEFEERPCAEIADLFNIPVGTVHSRLHAARKDFKKSLERLAAKERKGR